MKTFKTVNIITRSCSNATRPLLSVSALCLITMWMISGFGGWWPFGITGSNHGPWRHFLIGRLLLNMALALPLIAAAVAAIGFAVGGRSRKLTQGFLGIPIFVLILITHFWLID